MLNENCWQDKRIPIYREGLLRNLTRTSDVEIGRIENLLHDRCIVESSQELLAGDVIEVSVGDAIFLGEVVHTRHENIKCFARIQFKHRLSQADSRRMMSQFAAGLLRLSMNP